MNRVGYGCAHSNLHSTSVYIIFGWVIHLVELKWADELCYTPFGVVFSMFLHFVYTYFIWCVYLMIIYLWINPLYTRTCQRFYTYIYTRWLVYNEKLQFSADERRVIILLLFRFFLYRFKWKHMTGSIVYHWIVFINGWRGVGFSLVLGVTITSNTENEKREAKMINLTLSTVASFTIFILFMARRIW